MKKGMEEEGKRGTYISDIIKEDGTSGIACDDPPAISCPNKPIECARACTYFDNRHLTCYKISDDVTRRVLKIEQYLSVFVCIPHVQVSTSVCCGEHGGVRGGPSRVIHIIRGILERINTSRSMLNGSLITFPLLSSPRPSSTLLDPPRPSSTLLYPPRPSSCLFSIVVYLRAP